MHSAKQPCKSIRETSPAISSRAYTYQKPPHGLMQPSGTHPAPHPISLPLMLAALRSTGFPAFMPQTGCLVLPSLLCPPETSSTARHPHLPWLSICTLMASIPLSQLGWMKSHHLGANLEIRFFDYFNLLYIFQKLSQTQLFFFK